MARLIGFGLLLAVALLAIWLTDLHLRSVRATPEKAVRLATPAGH